MRRVICLFIVILLFGYKTAHAQISAPGSVLAESTDYREGAKEDIIYTFIAQAGSVPSGSLLAEAPEGTDSCDYTWTRFNPLTHQFDILLSTDTDAASSSLSNLAQGGYQVEIKRTGLIDTSFRAWVYAHVISLDVLETAEGKLPDNKFTCEYVELNASIEYDSLYYANPLTGTPRVYFLKPAVSWDFINKKESRSGAFTGTYVRTYLPPAYNTTYVATAADRSGLKALDSVLYESIQTEALFSFQVKDRQDQEAGRDFREAEDEESAPLEVEFINSSANGSEFTWVLTDTLFGKQKKLPPVITTDTADRPHYIYYYPHSYTVTLYSKSIQGCIDSVDNEKPLKIKPSKLSVPNYFIAGTEGTNSRFAILRDVQAGTPVENFATIKSFSVQIFSRQGRRVYEFEGDINEWEGWDGKVKGIGIPASEGVYFYVIEARGYDGKVYKGEMKQIDGSKALYTGFLYLFRE